MSEEMDKNKNLFSQAFPEDSDNRDVIEDTLGCLLGRLSLLDSVVDQRCHQMKDRLQQILNFQVSERTQGACAIFKEERLSTTSTLQTFIMCCMCVAGYLRVCVCVNVHVRGVRVHACAWVLRTEVRPGCHSSGIIHLILVLTFMHVFI